jgi:ABC-type uncharacterized transport system substrate-binding protein
LPRPALQRETQTIPIVFTSVSDPVGSGFVASLIKPGGNITGFISKLVARLNKEFETVPTLLLYMSQVSSCPRFKLLIINNVSTH